MSTNEKILIRIKNLLTLAEDGADDKESQTALLMAQKLMLKYKISQNHLSNEKTQKIINKSLSVYKRLYWWEKVLVQVIADNFRVMFYVQSNRFPHQKSIQRKLVLMGYPEDVELAYEVFHMAAAAMKHYGSLHVKKDTSKQADSKIRRAYYQGFIDGLAEKFDKQKEHLRAEDEKYALAIRTPLDVQDKFQREIKGLLAFDKPEMDEGTASYLEGFEKGSNISLQSKLIEQ